MSLHDLPQNLFSKGDQTSMGNDLVTCSTFSW